MANIVIPLGVIVGLAASLWCFQTRGWWIPAAASTLAGFALLTSIPENHGDVGGIGALGAGIQMLAGLGLFGVAVICFAVGAIVHRASAKEVPEQAARPQLPVATLVAGGDGRSQDSSARAVR